MKKPNVHDHGPYFLETLEKSQLRINSTDRYIYHLKRYDSRLDLLGSDTSWGYLTKADFKMLSKCAKWECTERQRPKPESITRIKFKTVYSREVKQMSDTAKANAPRIIQLFMMNPGK